MELTSLLVTIGLKDGRHHYPPFNELPPGIRGNVDWSHFVDETGGWHYDKSAGHTDDDPDNDSPRGVWLGMLLVPDDFAQAAVTNWPSQCRIITEQESESFYQERVHGKDPEELIDTDRLNGIVAKDNLGLARTDHDNRALDPNDDTPGITINKMKQWSEYKSKRGITIKP